MLPDRDKKAGARVQRPLPSRDLPFREIPGAFEPFLMTWNYLNVYGYADRFDEHFTSQFIHSFPLSIPLHLSTFTLDEFEAALRHNTSDPPCALIGEIHATLIYNLRTVSFARQTAITSILESVTARPVFCIHHRDLVNAMLDVGNNWERVPLRAAEGREGWEEAMVGCLTDVRHSSTLFSRWKAHSSEARL